MGTEATRPDPEKELDVAARPGQAGAPGWWGRARSRLGLERNILVMLGVILLVGLGEEMWVRFLPQYLVVLGAGTWGVAAYGALRDLLDAVYQYPGGWLADRLGRRRALMLFTLVAAAGYGVYLLAPSWQWVLLGTVLVMAWDSLTLPALFAVVGDTLPQNRRAAGFGMQSLLRRVPTIVAPPVGGALVMGLGFAAGMEVGLALTVGLALLAAWLVARFYRDVRPPAGPPGAALAFFVAGLCEVGEPARKALIVDLAHASVRGRAIGLYYLLRNLSVFPTALLGGLLWSTFGPRPVFYVAFGVGVLGFLAYALWGDDDVGKRHGLAE